MNELVLDAWGLVGWLRREQPAADHMQSLWELAQAGQAQPAMNLVNFGEIFYTLTRYRGRPFAIEAIADLRLGLAVVPASEMLTLRAADLKAGGGFSYADCFAAATALERNTPLVTGDPELQRLAGRVPALRLHWIGA